MDKWYSLSGDQSDTVISTRIRLARNIDDIAFPWRLDFQGKTKVNELVKNAVFEEFPEQFGYISMTDLSHLQAVSLAERHVISPEFTSCEEGTGLLISSDESVSIMICEEDHIRLQVMKSGLALSEAYKTADSIDNSLDKSLHYAFDERIGYMTADPTNLGHARFCLSSSAGAHCLRPDKRHLKHCFKARAEYRRSLRKQKEARGRHLPDFKQDHFGHHGRHRYGKS